MPENEEDEDVEGDIWSDLAIEAGRVFTPTSPIDERSLFAGRTEQVRQILDVISQKGQHAALYGERGVGKTSLANVLSSFLSGPTNVVAPRVNCDSTDTFDSVWRKIFGQITFSSRRAGLGFGASGGTVTEAFSNLLGEEAITPESVKLALSDLSDKALPIVIIDEFDRLGTGPRRAFADTIKTLSDHAVRATVILIGVADGVEQLIEQHLSVQRALVQVQLPRMSKDEIERIVHTGAKRLKMTIESSAVARISKLSQGLPHYTHLLGLHAARNALDARKPIITSDDVRAAVTRAIGGAQHSIRSDYDLSIRSARKDNLFADVLLACALATPNDLGFFAAQDVREPLRQITGRNYDIPSFAKHLNGFCEATRGPILHKDGTPRLYRYRFIDPLLQPFVIMRGLTENRITMAALDA